MRLAAGAALGLVLASPLGAQEPRRINLLAYQLGVDVPEAPALVALGVAPPLRAGSAPRPTGVTALAAVRGAETVYAGAIDLTPYFELGGGIRDLASYRSRSLGGRLLRVLTKTIVSVGAARSSADPGATELGLGLRATWHDPHDAVLNLPFAEEVAAAFAQAGVPHPSPDDENVVDHGVELGPVFARARRTARARAGDPMVSAGWGLATRLGGGLLAGDSVGAWRHSLWASVQYPFGPRYDLVGSGELRGAFRTGSRFTGGLALRRKGPTADVQVGLRLHTGPAKLAPSLLVEHRLGPQVGAVAWVEVLEGRPTQVGRRLGVGVAGRWFVASDRLAGR